MKSFSGESQARNRYTFFAAVARKEGLIQIALIFEETVAQEKEHAKRFFDFLGGGVVEITDTYPAGKAGTTLENLKAAVAGEAHEWGSLYPGVASIAVTCMKRQKHPSFAQRACIPSPTSSC